jgi:hypothetical protein
LQILAQYVQRKWLVLHGESFPDLIEAMSAARTQENGANDWSLDKQTRSMDILDALRLCCWFNLTAPGTNTTTAT